MSEPPPELPPAHDITCGLNTWDETPTCPACLLVWRDEVHARNSASVICRGILADRNRSSPDWAREVAEASEVAAAILPDDPSFLRALTTLCNRYHFAVRSLIDDHYPEVARLLVEASRRSK